LALPEEVSATSPIAVTVPSAPPLCPGVVTRTGWPVFTWAIFDSGTLASITTALPPTTTAPRSPAETRSPRLTGTETTRPERVERSTAWRSCC